MWGRCNYQSLWELSIYVIPLWFLRVVQSNLFVCLEFNTFWVFKFKYCRVLVLKIHVYLAETTWIPVISYLFIISWFVNDATAQLHQIINECTDSPMPSRMISDSHPYFSSSNRSVVGHPDLQISKLLCFFFKTWFMLKHFKGFLKASVK